MGALRQESDAGILLGDVGDSEDLTDSELLARSSPCFDGMHSNG